MVNNTQDFRMTMTENIEEGELNEGLLTTAKETRRLLWKIST